MTAARQCQNNEKLVPDVVGARDLITDLLITNGVMLTHPLPMPARRCAWTTYCLDPRQELVPCGT